ncbi:Putative STAS domain protein [Arthrobacter sp. 9V]|uniref:STAS domain-containing protein n=1 Tax=Arthrobacter sp. 9V TaxID=2653132 RepID=UPI0012F22C6B|nr:STAS domain-containing protein [Arthrobacter sp. 9V]VXC20912.1 Putative STAS domain protein [Arthrobacter sp. 9V]
MYMLSHAPNPTSTALSTVDLTMTGALDAATVLAIRQASAMAAADGPILVVLDVAELTSVGASGVVGLLEVLHVLRSRGGDLRLYGDSRHLQETRLQAHLGQIARIYANRQEAIDGGATLARPRGLAPRFRWRSLLRLRRRSIGWG